MTTEIIDTAGHFGQYGGRFVPEALIGALNDLEVAHNSAQQDPLFLIELAELHKSYSGRPSIITEAPRFAKQQTCFQCDLETFFAIRGSCCQFVCAASSLGCHTKCKE